MAAKHPETELVPYLRGGLGTDRRALVEQHLEQCAQCRESAESASAILSQLSAAVAAVPAPDWVAYRADLQSKLLTARREPADARGRSRSFVFRMPAFGWPSIAIGAAAAAMLAIVLVTHRGSSVQAPGVDQLELQTDIGSADVGLLANYRVVEHLDLLENYDVIEHLDELAPGDHQNHEASS
jgi:anti-sigma factor RsiW